VGARFPPLTAGLLPDLHFHPLASGSAEGYAPYPAPGFGRIILPAMYSKPSTSTRYRLGLTVATLCLALFALSLVFPLRAANPAAPAPADRAADFALGQRQVEKLWAGFARPDLAALDRFVAPGFQSLHEDGARDWAEERLLVADLKLTPYVLFGYKVSRDGDVLVVTYQCRVGETIDDARLAKVSTPRLDVFQQIDGDWKLLSHVNVRKLLPSSPAGSAPMMIAGSRD